MILSPAISARRRADGKTGGWNDLKSGRAERRRRKFPELDRRHEPFLRRAPPLAVAPSARWKSWCGRLLVAGRRESWLAVVQARIVSARPEGLRGRPSMPDERVHYSHVGDRLTFGPRNPRADACRSKLRVCSSEVRLALRKRQSFTLAWRRPLRGSVAAFCAENCTRICTHWHSKLHSNSTF